MLKFNIFYSEWLFLEQRLVKVIITVDIWKGFYLWSTYAKYEVFIF